jgi:hypothetical protein
MSPFARHPLALTLAGAVLAAAAAAWSAPPAGAAAGPQIQVSTSTTLPGVATRLVLSTNATVGTTTGVISVANTGTSTLTVTSVDVTGAQASSFQVTNPVGAFTVPAGGSTNVTVRFMPPSGSPIEQRATATVRSNDAVSPAAAVALAAAFAPGTDGPGEPSLPQLLRTLGYTTSTGPEGTSNYISNNRAVRGDERISPYWLPASPGSAVTVRPIARYVQHTTPCPCGRTRWALRYPDPAKDLISFPADNANGTFGPGNEKLFPSFTGTTSFSPSGPFQLFSDAGVSSDDGRNANAVHDWRFYPAKDAAGAAVPNTWIGAFDTGTVAADKNWDYQDAVYLITNAKPELTVAGAPSAAGLKLDFDVAKSGTLLDGTGKGTGFTSVQANDAGTQYDPSKLALNTGTGELAVTAAPGTFIGSEDSQVNALQQSFDAARYRSRLSARLNGPLTGLTGAGASRAGVFFGPDTSNIVTVDVSSTDGNTFKALMSYEAFSDYPYEHNAAGRTVAIFTLPQSGAAVQSVDVRLNADLVTGQITGQYRVNSPSLTDASAPWTTLGTVAPRDLTRWFSTQARAGIRTSRVASAPTTVVKFDAMRVDTW